MDSLFVVPCLCDDAADKKQQPHQRVPLSWVILGGMGGMAQFLSRNLRQQKPIKPASFIFALLANCFISGFAGPIAALYVSTQTEDKTWMLIAAGIGGYLGIELLNLISAVFHRTFTKHHENRFL